MEGEFVELVEFVEFIELIEFVAFVEFIEFIGFVEFIEFVGSARNDACITSEISISCDG